ncbi:hypothetical protein [Microbacterium invictum]|uniref:Major facilitator superfamily (MFS) profile domain-containing protein n=1 Tax=Microbacterium invictum TaxID=515415 RepID=A0ABZ0VB24_9MICO|nr:hypothetical protein [Microbacterium invictum]WQB70324.1 hypothetical protein T9R20_16755 [Microbacterium invictum]
MTAGFEPGYSQGYGPGYAAMPAPQGAPKKGFDILGLIAVIIAMVCLLPTLFVFLVGLIPEMNAIWWLLIVMIPALGIGGALVLILAIAGLIVGVMRQRRFGLSITGIVLGMLMVVPIGLLYFSSMM